jgi:O-antigen ligase
MTASFFVGWILAGRDTKDRKRLLQGGAGVVLVLVSMSLASWWSFWFGVCYCAVFTRRKAIVFFIFVIGTVLFFSLGADLRQSLLVRDKTQEKIETLSGRTLLWDDYMAASAERPLLGFGYAIGARMVSSIYSTNTHNSFYGALIGTGWVGVGIWVVFILALGIELLRYRHHRYPVWLACAAALAAGGLNSMSLSLLAENWHPATTVFMAFLGLHLCFLREAKMRRSEDQKVRRSEGEED